MFEASTVRMNDIVVYQEDTLVNSLGDIDSKLKKDIQKTGRRRRCVRDFI